MRTPLIAHLAPQTGFFLPGLLLCLLALSVPAADWPRWRGPDLNGVSAETNWFRPWPQTGPPILWRARVGIGFAGVSVSQGCLYTLGNSNDVDTVFCLHATSGREQWRHSYPCALDPRNYEGGPGATPTADGEAVYTLSKKGHLFRLGASTGRTVWSRNLTNEMDFKLPEWSLAGSPLVEGDLLILNVGAAGAAVDKHTGRTVWTSGPGPGGYATPVPFEYQGRRAIAIFSAKALVAVEPRTGREWWRHPWGSSRDVNAADPLIAGDKLFISSSTGCALLQLRDGPPTVLWSHTDLMRNYFNPAVLLDGHLYGIDGTTHRPTTLTCLDWTSGQPRWSEPGFGSGGLMAADGRLIIFDKGQLSVVRAAPGAFQLLAQAQVLGGKCWTAPVLSHGRIYVRNAAGDLVCVAAGGDGP
jgi:outer membrane protein assembly factor BamB